jgi:hypothetical protein
MLAGAVYKPLRLMLPALAGLKLQVTAAVQSPTTVGVNCWVWELRRPTATGLTVTPI